MGTHCAPDLTQLEQGNLRSHLILRWWQSTQASTRLCLVDGESSGGAAGDVVEGVAEEVPGVVFSRVGRAVDMAS